MVTLGERGFHAVLGLSLLAALAFDTLVKRHLPGWNPPEFGITSLAVAFFWVARYATWRAELNDERARVAADRIERLERKLAALDAELAEQRPPQRR
ncbi:MAG: hypothetical protein AB7I19_06040 [Planctomycetota bacterium]